MNTLPAKASEDFVLLNSTYEQLNTCSWKRAVVLILKNKAKLIAERTLLLLYYVKVSFSNSFKHKRKKQSKRTIFRRDQYSCVYCGSNSKLTIDHVIPKSRGGSNDISNLVTACEPCNNQKSNKSLDTFLREKNLSLDLSFLNLSYF